MNPKKFSAYRKWPGNSLKGEANARARLKEEDVLEIRASPLKNVELARIFKVTPPTISAIRRRISWKHIP